MRAETMAFLLLVVTWDKQYESFQRLKAISMTLDKYSFLSGLPHPLQHYLSKSTAHHWRCVVR